MPLDTLIVGLLFKLIVFCRSRRRVVGCILLRGSFIENVTFKMNPRFFNLCRIYFSARKMSNVGEFP